MLHLYTSQAEKGYRACCACASLLEKPAVQLRGIMCEQSLIVQCGSVFVGEAQYNCVRLSCR